MKIDYKRLGRYLLLVNLLITVLVVYVAVDFMPGEAAPDTDSRLFAPVRPLKQSEPERKGIFRDYTVITADRFLPQPDLQPGEAMPLLPVPGASSALDRLVKLRGTAVSSEKEQSCAIVELLQSGEHRTVKAGDEMAGATVLEVGESSILVSMENEEITLSLNATEEYGRSTARKREQSRGQNQSRETRERPGRQRTGSNGVPPEIQERIKNLPPEMRRRWESASPEQRREYIKKFMQARQRGEGERGARTPRNPDRQR
jgi:hypothetical protein